METLPAVQAKEFRCLRPAEFGLCCCVLCEPKLPKGGSLKGVYRVIGSLKGVYRVI